MNRKQIIGAINLATGKEVAEVAKEHMYTKSAFYDVIKGRTKTPKLRSLISSITGIAESKLWPDSDQKEEQS